MSERLRGMSRRQFAAAVTAALAARPLRAGAQATPRPAADALAGLRRAFADPPNAAKPMTRWWWFGGAVTPEEITRELGFMKEAGLRGAEIQPVYPVTVDDASRGIRHLQYFSEDFQAMLRHAIREARRLELQLDFTLGSGWPYGGPFVSANLGAQRLRMLSQDAVGPREFAWDVTPQLTGDDRAVAVVAAPLLPSATVDLARAQALSGQPAADPTGVRRASFVRFRVPEGTWRVMLFLDSPTGQLVKRPTLGMEGYVLDHHNREALDLFLRAAGDRVMDALRDAGTPPFHTVFCDSLEVYGADYTPRFLEEFQKRRGYDLRPHLPAMFFECGEKTPHVRYDYHLTLSELNLDCFFRPLVEWAGKRGMQARIQAHGAPCDVIQAYGVAHIPEGENIFLGDRYQVNLRHRRLASSAAHLYGKPLASSETYTWLRTPLYTTTLEQMKPASDAVLLDGLNHIMNHGYSYSPSQAGEPGWSFYASTEANHTNTWWRHYPHLARYVQRACALLQQGVSVNPVGVYFPVADLFAQFGAGGLHIDVEAEGQIDPRLFSGLRRGGYDFDMVHDHALATLARVEAGTLVAGTARYAAMIVPAARFMPPESAARLLEFAQAGGQVIFVGRFPEAAPGLQDQDARDASLQQSLKKLKSLRTVALVGDAAAAVAWLETVLHPDFRIVRAGDDSPAAQQAAIENVGFAHRKAGAADYYFVANLSARVQELRVDFDAGHRRPEVWRTDSGAVEATPVSAFVMVNGRRLTNVALQLEPFESVFVVFGTGSEAPLVARSDWNGALEIRRDGAAVDVSGLIPANGPYSLTLASGHAHRFEVNDIPAALDITGPWRLALGSRPAQELAALRSWNELPDGRHFSGWGTYETEFDAPEPRADLAWWIDLGTVHETAEVTLNGKPLGAAWKGLRRVACGDALKAGRNLLKVAVANLWIHDMMNRQPPPEWKTLDETWGIRWGRYGEVKPESVPPSGLLGPVRLSVMKRHKERIRA